MFSLEFGYPSSVRFTSWKKKWTCNTIPIHHGFPMFSNIIVSRISMTSKFWLTNFRSGIGVIHWLIFDRPFFCGLSANRRFRQTFRGTIRGLSACSPMFCYFISFKGITTCKACCLLSILCFSPFIHSVFVYKFLASMFPINNECFSCPFANTLYLGRITVRCNIHNVPTCW